MGKHLFLTIILAILMPLGVHGETRQDALSQLYAACEQARSLSQFERLDTLSGQLILLAEQQRNTRLQTYGYFFQGLAKLFCGHGEESQQLCDQAEEMADKMGNDTVKALVLNARGIYHALMQNNNYVAQQYFFRSLELAQKTGNEDLTHRVKGNLLTLSHDINDSTALDIAREVYKYGVETKNDEQEAMGAYYLATYYYNQANYVQAKKYLDIALDTYKRYPYEDIEAVYLLYAKMLTAKGDLEQAEQMAIQSEELACTHKQPSLEVEAYFTHAEILNIRHQYQASIEMVETAMNLAGKIGTNNKVIDCNQLMAKNYLALNQDSKAVRYLQQANKLLAEQSTINMDRLSHEQRIMREIEQKEMDAILKQQQIAEQRKVMAMLLAIVGILLVMVVMMVIVYRRRNKLYKSIVLQNYRAVAREKQLKQQIANLMQQQEQRPVATPTDKEGSDTEKGAKKDAFVMDNDKVEQLYTKLCRLMDEEHLYTEANLTREKMAERLETNRTYLMHVIKEKTNMNYLQFVNSYRINEAIRILSDKSQMDYPLKQIWSDLGFTSPSTFFKLFQQTVGITPSTYRKQFYEVNHEAEGDNDEEDIIV